MLAANVHFPKIGEAFSLYNAFKEQPKIATTAPVVLEQPHPNLEFIGTSPVEMGWQQFDCELEITKTCKLLMKYTIKLFAKQFDDKPCLRFKSRGSEHFNIESGGGLASRAVPCPHFYRVDTRGILEAYRTPPLEDPEESNKIAGNPQLGTNYFCQEANLFSPSGVNIELAIIATELDLSTKDPLSGATFPKQ